MKEKVNNNIHHAGRYIRPRVSVISLEHASHLLQSSGGGGDTPIPSGNGPQVNYAHGMVLGSLGGPVVAGGNFGYGGENSGTDYAE